MSAFVRFIWNNGRRLQEPAPSRSSYVDADSTWYSVDDDPADMIATGPATKTGLKTRTNGYRDAWEIAAVESCPQSVLGRPLQERFQARQVRAVDGETIYPRPATPLIPSENPAPDIGPRPVVDGLEPYNRRRTSTPGRPRPVSRMSVGSTIRWRRGPAPPRPRVRRAPAIAAGSGLPIKTSRRCHHPRRHRFRQWAPDRAPQLLGRLQCLGRPPQQRPCSPALPSSRP